MLSHIFLGMSLIGAEWVLYLLLILSVLSITLIFERLRFYSAASRGLQEFRAQIRKHAAAGQWDEASKLAAERTAKEGQLTPDLEAQMAHALLTHRNQASPDVLSEVAQDPVVRARLYWDRNLTILAT